MSTDFRLSKRIAMHELFDGRLERFGITEWHAADESIESGNGRYLGDGGSSVVVWGTRSENGSHVRVSLLTRCGDNDPNHILHAIQAAFDVEIFSEHEPQYWGYESFEELYAEYEAQTKGNRDAYYDELIRYVRGEPNGITPGTAGETLANIAKVVAKRRPEVTSPDAREMLFKSMVAELKSSLSGTPELFCSWG